MPHKAIRDLAMTENQNPEQKARDTIDALLKQAGWVVQSARKIDLNSGLGQAVRAYAMIIRVSFECF